jgi:hypothetical protein
MQMIRRLEQLISYKWYNLQVLFKKVYTYIYSDCLTLPTKVIIPLRN